MCHLENNIVYQRYNLNLPDYTSLPVVSCQPLSDVASPKASDCRRNLAPKGYFHGDPLHSSVQPEAKIRGTNTFSSY